MKKLQFKVKINAPVEKVFDFMLGLTNKATYEQWTFHFNPTSSYDGKWDKGSRIYFVGLDENGNKGGMVSEIVENIPHEFVSIQHLGLLVEGKEVLEGTEVEKWASGLEKYSFAQINGITTIKVEIDVIDEFENYMNSCYPKALQQLKEICEK